VIKGWLTEIGFEVANLGVQVHGGMGYIEETGAAQYLRDVRIASIYEGTNGIQAADLVARKIRRDGGSTMAVVLSEIESTIEPLLSSDNKTVASIASAVDRALGSLRASVEITLQRSTDNIAHALLGSFDLMMQCGYVFGGWHLLRSAALSDAKLVAGSDNPFYRNKMVTADFYARHVLPRAAAHGEAVHNADALFLEAGATAL
jgi:homoserine kinase